jgi:hypothetical protein
MSNQLAAQAVGGGQDTHGAEQLNAPIGSHRRRLEAQVCAPTRESTVQAQGSYASRTEGQTNEPMRTAAIID